MPQATEYHLWYSTSATEFLFALPPRDQRRLSNHANELVRNPFLRRGYRLSDHDGHELEHHVAGIWILTYWVDHAHRSVMLVEVENKD